MIERKTGFDRRVIAGMRTQNGVLTVADALNLKDFEGARVMAGRRGLNRQVLWLHMAAVPDAADWLDGGELVLTTVINMPPQPDEQVKYVQAMANKGVAGLVLTVGKYLNEIPSYLCDVADECNFPLIELPFTARFVDIAKSVNERISVQNIDMVRRALQIHQTLTRIVLEGGGLKELANKLVDLVGHSISIENERFEAIANKNIAEIDEARRYTLLHGRTNPQLVEALETRNVLPEIRQTLRPVHIPKMEDVGLEMERILAPIVVHSEIYGYIWIIADDHALSQIDMMALEIGSTIAALMLLYQESVQSAEASLKGSLLSQLIQGDVTRETILTDQSLRYGVDLRTPFVAMIIEDPDTSSRHLHYLYRQINQLVTNLGWQAVAGQFAGQVVLLVQADQNLYTLAEHITHRLSSGRKGARVGISARHKTAENVVIAHRQCQEVLRITKRLKNNDHIVMFDDLGYLHALYHAGPDSLIGNPYVPVLRILLEEKQADLFNTLEAYLDAGGNGVQTAEILHIHRSTLNYRLTRIHEIGKVELESFDLSDPGTRMNLQVALKLMRLFEVD